jgi:hypothetical protein
MSGTIRLPAGMLNQRIDHPLSNQRDNIFIQFHRLFNMGAQLRVARWRFANNHPTHLIVVIINDVCVSPSPNLNIWRQM